MDEPKLLELLATDTPHERARKLLMVGGLAMTDTAISIAGRMAEAIAIYSKLDKDAPDEA